MSLPSKAIVIHPSIPKLRTLCQSWGGHLVLLDWGQWKHKFEGKIGDRGEPIYVPENHGFHEAPASPHHGLHYDQKIVFALEDEAHPGRLIHEMGHIIRDQRKLKST